MIKRNGPPREHLNMLARNLIELFEGDCQKTFLKMVILSQCEEEYLFKYDLSMVLIYPGTPGEMSIETYERLYLFFKKNKNNSALIELVLKECVDEEAEIYYSRTKEDREDLLLSEQKVK